MKFYLEVVEHRPRTTHRRAHIVKLEANRQNGGCWCNAPLSPKNWVLAEELPAGTHLCKKCEALFQKNRK